MKNLSIKKKILTLITSAVIFLLIISIGGFITLTIWQKSSEMYEDSLLPIQYIGQALTDFRAMDSFVLELMITTDANDNTELKTMISES